MAQLVNSLVTASYMVGGFRALRRLGAIRMQTPELSYHVPVLRDELVDLLITDPSGIYCDGTLGGGGHSEALLQVLAGSGGRLIALDRDADALHAAGERLSAYTATGAATLLRSNFGAMSEALSSLPEAQPGCGWLDGILLDIGVSSHQLDEAERGFSFMREGPLDMRMDKREEGDGDGDVGAAVLVNEWDAASLADVLWKYGELRESRRLARAIVEARPLKSTVELAEVVARAIPGPFKVVTKRTARVFQALRIEVNSEISELEAALTAAVSLVRPGGRLAVMSYHSLEDTRVKRFLRSGSFTRDSPPRDAYGNALAPWKVLTRKPVYASEDEIARNPRSRSVRLRVGERTVHGPIQ
ncbi:hypothetical protein AB1Y20_021140 [Prymnesium parvum]|uniref:Uncharacterized protein n=1 Tax=Prymnesium parvum TaxID=97485 RepID=A0AB34JIR4_PRYPA